MQNADLHCHSYFSDGTLAPSELVRRAAHNGVEILALTDHDHLGGLAEAEGAARQCGVRFIPGVEISVSWRAQTLHVVGLDVDPSNAVLEQGLQQVRAGRDQRARLMAEALEAVGIPGAFEGALRFCANPALLGRSHFARYIVEQGYARDVGQVFERYLVPGKPGYTEHVWARLEDALSWILKAGGVAVLAHPARYRLSQQAFDQMLADFKGGGGRAIEVCSGSHDDAAIRRFARVAREHDLLASRASDFHSPEEGTDLGGAPALPVGLKPVWSHLPNARPIES